MKQDLIGFHNNRLITPGRDGRRSREGVGNDALPGKNVSTETYVKHRSKRQVTFFLNLSRFEFKIKNKTVADPEFPRGGALTLKLGGVY